MGYVHGIKINGQELRPITENFALEPFMGEDGVMTFKVVKTGTYNEVPNNNGRYKLKHKH